MKKWIAAILSVLLLASSLCLPVMAESRVDRLLSGMTTRQKIMQMMMMSFRQWYMDAEHPEDISPVTALNPQLQKIIEDHDFGAVILFADNLPNTEDSFGLTMALQAAATKNQRIPLLIATDQEGGSVYRLGSGTALPGNMALGATGDVNTAYESGKIIAKEISALGINTTLAPVVDVNNNANNPVIGLRSFGDTADMVQRFAAATITGLSEYNVIGCAKHFPGHGDTATDSHYGLPVVDKPYEELIHNELQPYTYLVRNGIDMIMTAHILYPQLEKDTVLSKKTGQQESLPATMSDDILTGLLKNQMGFEGVVCTDAMNMAGITDQWDALQAATIAINAGADLLCMPIIITGNDQLSQLDGFIDGLTAAVESGEIPVERVNDACRRILTLKEKRGILDFSASDYSLETARSVIGCAAHRETERQIAAKAVTVVQNNGVLPIRLKKGERVAILTPYDNETGQLAMGWNRAKEAGLIPKDATVEVVRYENADLTRYGSSIKNADVVIIVSEISSATAVKEQAWTYAAPRDFLKFAKEQGKKAVILSVSKPYDVQLYPTADAVMAVYGCKGSDIDPTEALLDGTTHSSNACGPNMIAGIEVAFGVFGASGKLPVAIPKLNAAQGVYETTVVFDRGFGLTYSPVSPQPDVPSEPSEPSPKPHTPADPEPLPPETGDHSADALPICLSLMALALAGFTLLISKKARRS